MPCTVATSCDYSVADSRDMCSRERVTVIVLYMILGAFTLALHVTATVRHWLYFFQHSCQCAIMARRRKKPFRLSHQKRFNKCGKDLYVLFGKSAVVKRGVGETECV